MDLIKDQTIITECEDDTAQKDYLRPKTLSEFVGQQKLKDILFVSLQAAKKRNEPIDHILFYGPPGLGKTTMARIVAKEMDANIVITSGPSIEKAGELAAILNNLSEHDVLFIDEIHRLNRQVEEILYPAMEERAIDITIGKGPEARAIRLELAAFTLIGATTRAGMLSSPLRDRFGIIGHMEYYTVQELSQIVEHTFSILNLHIQKESAIEIAQCSRGTPRIANRLAKRIRDYSQVLYQGELGLSVVKEILQLLQVRIGGIDESDMLLLDTIQNKFRGGPVGVETLAASTGEDVGTIKDVIEPYLLKEGYLMRTSRGRTITERGIKLLESG